MKDVTVEQWLSELEKCSQKTGTGLSTREIVNKIGHTVRWVQENILQPAKQQGRLIAEFRTQENVSGLKTIIPVYRFKRRGK